MNDPERIHDRLIGLAWEVGRLRRNVEPDSYAAHLVSRFAEDVESVLLMLEPSAAELVALNYPGDDEAIDEALRIVDARHLVRREILGLKGE